MTQAEAAAMSDGALYAYAAEHPDALMAAAYRFAAAHPNLGWIWPGATNPPGIPLTLEAARMYPRYTDVVRALLPYVNGAPADTALWIAPESTLTPYIGAGYVRTQELMGLPVMEIPTYQTYQAATARTPAATNGGAGVTQTNEGVRQTVEVKEQILAMAAEYGAAAYTADQWGWFYKQVTGTDAPAPESLGYTRAADMGLPEVSFADWWAKVETFLGAQVSVSTGRQEELGPVTGGGAMLPAGVTDWLKKNQLVVLIVLLIVFLVFLLRS